MIINILFVSYRISIRIEIGLVSGNKFEVNHTLKEVKEKLGIDIESTDYKRTARAH